MTYTITNKFYNLVLNQPWFSSTRIWNFKKQENVYLRYKKQNCIEQNSIHRTLAKQKLIFWSPLVSKYPIPENEISEYIQGRFPDSFGATVKLTLHPDTDFNFFNEISKDDVRNSLLDNCFIVCGSLGLSYHLPLKNCMFRPIQTRELQHFFIIFCENENDLVWLRIVCRNVIPHPIKMEWDYIQK